MGLGLEIGALVRVVIVLELCLGMAGCPVRGGWMTWKSS